MANGKIFNDIMFKIIHRIVNTSSSSFLIYDEIYYLLAIFNFYRHFRSFLPEKIKVTEASAKSQK